MTPAACPGCLLADSAALRLAGRRRLRRQPSLALAGVMTLARVARRFAGARAFAGVDADALDSRRLLGGSGSNS